MRDSSQAPGAAEELIRLMSYAKGLQDYAGFVAAGGSGTALNITVDDIFRVDPSRFRQICAVLKTPPLVSVSVFARPGAFLVNEDNIVLEPEWVAGLQQLAADKNVQVRLRNELAEAFCRTQRNPWQVFEELIDSLQQAGIDAPALAAPSFKDPLSELSLLLSRSGFAGSIHDVVMGQYGLYGTELSEAVRKTRTGRLHFEDGIQLIRFRHGAETRFSPTLWSSITTFLKPIPHFMYATELIRDQAGWIARSNEKMERRVSIDEAITILSGVGASCLISVGAELIANVNAISANSEYGLIRTYPQPFSAELAMSNDIDSTTPEKLRALVQLLNVEFGLPLASSFFLISGEDWISLFDQAGVVRSSKRFDAIEVAHWHQCGVIDTLHGLAESVFVCRLVRDPSLPHVFHAEPAIPLSWGCGFIVSARGSIDSDASILCYSTQDQKFVPIAPSERGCCLDAAGRRQLFYPITEPLRNPRSQEWEIHLPSDASVEEVIFVDLDPRHVRESLAGLNALGLKPAVFVAHGNNAQHFGGLMTGQIKSKDAFQGCYSGDEPGSLYQLLPNMKAAGLCFFNIQGAAGTQHATSFEQLIFEHTLADGTKALAFRRYASSRYRKLFSSDFAYGKNLSHQTAFATVAIDLLNMFACNSERRSAILYTHLGEGIGNKRTNQLSALEEFRSALTQLAASYHSEGRPDGNDRVWLTSTAQLLRYRASLAAIRQNVIYLDNGFDIRLAALDGYPNPADLVRFGTKLLDRISVRVHDAHLANVHVGGVRTDWVSRERWHDGDWIVFVDNTRLHPLPIMSDDTECEFRNAEVGRTTDLLLGDDWRDLETQLIAHESGPFSATWRFGSMSLLGEQGWSLRIVPSPGPQTDSGISHLKVSLVDELGTTYTASQSGEGGWTDPLLDRASPRRYVFRFEARRANPLGPPRTAIVGLRVEGNAETQGAQLRLSEICLVGNTVDLAPTAETVIVGGFIRIVPLGRHRPRFFEGLGVYIRLNDYTNTPVVAVRSNGAYSIADLPQHKAVCVVLIDHESGEEIARRPVIGARTHFDCDICI